MQVPVVREGLLVVHELLMDPDIKRLLRFRWLPLLQLVDASLLGVVLSLQEMEENFQGGVRVSKNSIEF